MKKLLVLLLILISFTAKSQIVFKTDTSTTARNFVPNGGYGISIGPYGLAYFPKVGNSVILRQGITSVNSVTGNAITLTTTNIAEGTNQYFTATRFNTSGDARYPLLSASYVNPTFITSIPFSKLTATPTTRVGYGITDAEGIITAGTSLQYFNGLKNFVTLNTAVVPELTNLYYTDVRSRLAKSATAPVVYNNVTGVISMPVASASSDGFLSSVNFSTFNSKANASTTLAGYGITDADPYTVVATYAAMDALVFAAGTGRRILIQNDEKYGQANQWYMVWADGGGVMRSNKLVVLTEK